MQLAGVAAITIPPNELNELAKMDAPEATLAKRSLFKGKANVEERQSFVDNEVAFRTAFSRSGSGKGQMQTAQVCCCFPFLLNSWCCNLYG